MSTFNRNGKGGSLADGWDSWGNDNSDEWFQQDQGSSQRPIATVPQPNYSQEPIPHTTEYTHQQQHGNTPSVNPQNFNPTNYDHQVVANSFNNYGNENPGGHPQPHPYYSQPASHTSHLFDQRYDQSRGFEQQTAQEQKSDISEPQNTGYLSSNVTDPMPNQFHHQSTVQNPVIPESKEFQQSVPSSLPENFEEHRQTYSQHYSHHQQQSYQNYIPQPVESTQSQIQSEPNQNQQREQTLSESKNYPDLKELKGEQAFSHQQQDFTEASNSQIGSFNNNMPPMDEQQVQKQAKECSYSDDFAQNIEKTDIKQEPEPINVQKEIIANPASETQNVDSSDLQIPFEKLTIKEPDERNPLPCTHDQFKSTESAEKVSMDTLPQPIHHPPMVDTASSSQAHSRQSSFGGANFIVGDYPDQISQQSDPPSNQTPHLSQEPENQVQSDPKVPQLPEVPMVRSDNQVSNIITSHPDSPFKPPKPRNSETQLAAQIRETQPPLKTENFSLYTPKNTPDFSPIVPNSAPAPAPEPDTPVARPKSVTEPNKTSDLQPRDGHQNKSENVYPESHDKERLGLRDNREMEQERRDLDKERSQYHNREYQNRTYHDNRERGQYPPENRDFDGPADRREYDSRYQGDYRDSYNRNPTDRRDDRRDHEGRPFDSRDPYNRRDDRREYDGRDERRDYDEKDFSNRRDQQGRRNVDDDRASESRENRYYSNMDRMYYNEGDRSRRPREKNEEDNRSRNDFDREEDPRRRGRDYYQDSYSRRRPDDPRYYSLDQSDYYRGYRNETRGRDRSRRGDTYDYPLSREPSYDRSYTRQREPSFDRSSNYGRPPSRGSAYGDDRPPSRQGYQYRDYYGYSNPDYARDYDSRFNRGYAEEMRSYGEKLQEYENNYKMWANFCKQYGQVPYQQQGVQSRGSTPAVGGTAADNFANTGQGSRPNSRMGQMMYPQPYPGMDMAYMYYNNPAALYQMSYQAEVRKTPLKYNLPHVRASFGPGGQLIKVLPNNPKEGQKAYVNLLKFTVESDVEELKRFPGPLVRGDTHKNDVLRFCQEEATLCRQDDYAVDRESILLLWNLLQFLIKQNGTVIGSDLAYLLLEGHEPSSADLSRLGVKAETTMNTSSAIDSSSINNNEKDSTDRFRHLLLFGRKKDALDWACKTGLWGHALFLASKMDSKTHAAIMTKFANVAMRMNDPLQTLYQLMSGRQPAAVTLVSDEKWGDWRPHLAMILANESRDKPDLDAKSLCVLGDTLAAKGCLHASHICYLTAKIHPGQYGQANAKYVLLGSSHYRPLEEFANNLAIQCTEVYEYAKSLAGMDEELSALIIRLLPYKFLYATRLYTAGMLEEAFHYCEVLAKTIVQYQGYFSYAIIVGVHKMANQLKFHTCEKGLYYNRDDGDPDWLIKLSQLVGMSSLQNPCYDVDSVSQAGGNDQLQPAYNQSYPVKEPVREEGVTEGEPDQPMQNSINDYDGGYMTYHPTAQYDSSNAGHSGLGQMGMTYDATENAQTQPPQTNSNVGYMSHSNNIARGAIGNEI